MSEQILVIEDEPKIADFIHRGLTYEGFRVQVANDGEAGLSAARENLPDLIVLDVMLPGLDGIEVCRRLRSGGPVPILMLTAKDAVADRVKGLESGADDYLTKPFAFEELLARVRALLRRVRPNEETILKFADLTLNVSTRQVTRGVRKVDLTTKEFDLLHFFMMHPRQVLTRELIYDRIWGYDFGGESNILEVYVRYLRTKLETKDEVRLLQTIRGVGYVLREE